MHLFFLLRFFCEYSPLGTAKKSHQNTSEITKMPFEMNRISKVSHSPFPTDGATAPRGRLLPFIITCPYTWLHLVAGFGLVCCILPGVTIELYHLRSASFIGHANTQSKLISFCDSKMRRPHKDTDKKCTDSMFLGMIFATGFQPLLFCFALVTPFVKTV